MRHPCRNCASRGYVEIRHGEAVPERGSRAWTNPWTGKKTPAHRFAHPAPLFHIPTGAIATLKKTARSRAKSDESNIPVGQLF